jgi:hypothetical protein
MQNPVDELCNVHCTFCPYIFIRGVILGLEKLEIMAENSDQISNLDQEANCSVFKHGSVEFWSIDTYSLSNYVYNLFYLPCPKPPSTLLPVHSPVQSFVSNADPKNTQTHKLSHAEPKKKRSNDLPLLLLNDHRLLLLFLLVLRHPCKPVQKHRPKHIKQNKRKHDSKVPPPVRIARAQIC